MFLLGVPALVMAMVALCKSLSPDPTPAVGKTLTNIIYFDNDTRQLQVVEMGSGTLKTNRVRPNDHVRWVSTNNLDFCVVFPRKENPNHSDDLQIERGSGMKAAQVNIQSRERDRDLKYSVVVFEMKPMDPPPTSPVGMTNTIAITVEDPFIIIRQN